MSKEKYENLLNKFQEEMRKKYIEHIPEYGESWMGLPDHFWFDRITDFFKKIYHNNFSKKDLVNLANLAMFYWEIKKE